MEHDPKEIELGTFRDACSRALLELILIPLRSQHKNQITIDWPLLRRYSGEETLDYTRAYISFNPNKQSVSYQGADIILEFIDNNLRVSAIKETRPCCNNTYTKRYFEVNEFSIANPEVHIEAITLITSKIRTHYEKHPPS